MNKKIIAVGCILAALSVAFGAMAAHALEKHVTEKMLKVFETAARYQMYHSLAIILCGVVYNNNNSRLVTTTYKIFLAGIILFSCSLYALSLLSLTGNENFKILGAITPFGGLCLIFGWLYLAYSLIKSK